MEKLLKEATELYTKLQAKHTKSNSLKLRNVLSKIKNQVTTAKRALITKDSGK